MKLVTLLLSIQLLCYCFVGNAQTGATPIPAGGAGIVCQYLLTYQPDSLSPTTKKDIFTLFIKSGKSLFKERLLLAHDSLLRVYGALPFTDENLAAMTVQMKQLTLPRFMYAVYKDNTAGEVMFTDRIGSAKYYYTEPTNVFSWSLLADRKTVAGYACQKAVATYAGRTWEAWFTREVAVSDGPYKFTGLPGLITQVADTKNQYQFALLSLAKSSLPVSVSPPTTGLVKTTKPLLVKGQKDRATNASVRIAAMGNTVTEEDKRAYNERQKRRNNPLELK